MATTQIADKGEYVTYTLQSHGFFSANVHLDYANDRLIMEATFVCGTVGFIPVNREYTVYKGKSEIVKEMVSAKEDYFKWKAMWEKANGNNAGEKS